MPSNGSSSTEQTTGQITIWMIFYSLLSYSCKFLQICEEINFPVALDKTVWSSQIIIFLGMLLNSVNQTVSIPREKCNKALNLLYKLVPEDKKKATVLQIQQLTGLLNHLGRVLVRGRSFTKCMCAKISGKLKQYHHVRLDAEFKLDCNMWIAFLESEDVLTRPFVDFEKETLSADEIKFFTMPVGTQTSDVVGYLMMSGLLCSGSPGILITVSPALNI